jgi:hypothetical protein
MYGDFAILKINDQHWKAIAAPQQKPLHNL